MSLHNSCKTSHTVLSPSDHQKDSEGIESSSTILFVLLTLILYVENPTESNTLLIIPVTGES